MLKLLKSKKGSASFALMLILVAMIPMFMYVFESASVYATKERFQTIADNAASAAVIQINEDKMLQKEVYIDEALGREAAKRIMEKSIEPFSETNFYTSPTLDFKALNSEQDNILTSLGESIVYEGKSKAVVLITVTTTDDMIFFKNKTIRVLGVADVDTDYSNIDDEEFYAMDRFDQRDMLKFRLK